MSQPRNERESNVTDPPTEVKRCRAWLHPGTEPQGSRCVRDQDHDGACAASVLRPEPGKSDDAANMTYSNTLGRMVPRGGDDRERDPLVVIAEEMSRLTEVRGALLDLYRAVSVIQRKIEAARDLMIIQAPEHGWALPGEDCDGRHPSPPCMADECHRDRQCPSCAGQGTECNQPIPDVILTCKTCHGRGTVDMSDPAGRP